MRNEREAHQALAYTAAGADNYVPSDYYAEVFEEDEDDVRRSQGMIGAGVLIVVFLIGMGSGWLACVLAGVAP